MAAKTTKSPKEATHLRTNRQTNLELYWIVLLSGVVMLLMMS